MNTTSVIDVSGLMSSLSARGVEKQLRRLPGVADVRVNDVAGSATVVYDAALTNLAALRAQVERCGDHCRGESVPDHLCEPREEHAVRLAQGAHKAGVEHGGARLQGAEHGAHSGRATGMDAMAHDMGHGAGMDARDMARDQERLRAGGRDPVEHGGFRRDRHADPGASEGGRPGPGRRHRRRRTAENGRAVEKLSEHPLALAILKRAQGLQLDAVQGFGNVDGMGARAELGGDVVLLGNDKLMTLDKVDMNGLEADSQRLQGQGRTVVHVARAGRLIGLVAIADAVRATSAPTVAALHARGVQVAMLTGDNRPTAERIAREIGIDIVLADVLPGDKAAKIRELQGQGKRVGMVGDGINDAPALTQADVGFAIGAGTDVAIESADVVLMKSDPFDVVGAIELSRATLRKMHQNLWWAVAYNVIAFPVAAGLFYPFTISPEVAALAMSGSSALVAVNALMLKRTRLTGIRVGSATDAAMQPRPATAQG